MPRLPVVSGKEVIKALSKAGFSVVRQKGSHVRLEKTQGEKIIKLTVPFHKELKKGTLGKIVDDAGMTMEEFVRLLG